MSGKNDIVLIAGIGLAAWLLLPKLARASAPTPAISRSAPIADKNVNDDMWARILGGAWKELTTDGSFLRRNLFGQVVTSDGTPVSSGSDAVANWMTATTGLPDAYGTELGLTVHELLGTADPTDPMDGFRNPYALW